MEGLRVYQPRRGYRYAMEPFLLVAWALEGGRPQTAADLGCGCGIGALLLARQGVRVTGYDIMAPWIDLARRSARESLLEATFVQADLRALPRPGVVEDAGFDLAILNPPYFAVAEGPASPDPLKAAARTEIHGDLDTLVAAGARVSERLCVVLPASRTRAGRAALERAGLGLTRGCRLDPALVLLEGKRGQVSRSPFEISSMREAGGLSPRVKGLYASLGARVEGHGQPRPG